ncbi:MAG TPA: AMP-binding protein [Trebonia sp.]|jgi:fatty-acyl-CoA synthase|nr:AMP-binding protein [Trebonia sp.]
MRLTEFLDKGASLHPDAPCLTVAGAPGTEASAGAGPRTPARAGTDASTRAGTRTYADVQRLSWAVARALDRSGILPGDKVAVLSGNDPVAFGCVFGIARAGAVWCPVDPRNGAAEDQELLDLFDCSCLIYARSFAPLVEKIISRLPKLHTLVCLDEIGAWLGGDSPWQADPADDVVMIASAAAARENPGSAGNPRGVMLTGRNIEAMTALTLMSYPFTGRPVLLAFAPLTHAAGFLCFPVMALGGEIVIMPSPDLGEFPRLVGQHRVTHAFLPSAGICALLDHPGLPSGALGSLQCLWYGSTPMPASCLAQAITEIGPVMGQLFGQFEAPMVISALSPRDHFRPDGAPAVERFTSVGKPTPLTTVAIMDDGGGLLSPGERGEVVIRGPLVMAGYYKDPLATAEVSRHGWHHTGDIGYLDDNGYLYITGRMRDVTCVRHAVAAT